MGNVEEVCSDDWRTMECITATVASLTCIHRTLPYKVVLDNSFTEGQQIRCDMPTRPLILVITMLADPQWLFECQLAQAL